MPHSLTLAFLLIAQTPNHAARIYATVLDTLTSSSNDTTLLVDSAYVTTLERGAAAPLPRAIPARHPIRFVPLVELTDSLGLGRESVNPTTYWTRFGRHFPTFPGWYALSPITLSDDQRTATVGYEWRCGPLCGQGGTITLAYDGSLWRVTSVQPLWYH